MLNYLLLYSDQKISTLTSYKLFRGIQMVMKIAKNMLHVWELNILQKSALLDFH